MHARVSTRCRVDLLGQVGSSRGQRDVLLASGFKLCLFLEHGATEQEGFVARKDVFLLCFFVQCSDSGSGF